MLMPFIPTKEGGFNTKREGTKVGKGRGGHREESNLKSKETSTSFCGGGRVRSLEDGQRRRKYSSWSIGEEGNTSASITEEDSAEVGGGKIDFLSERKGRSWEGKRSRKLEEST